MFGNATYHNCLVLRTTMSLCMIAAHVHSSSQSDRLSQLNRLFEEVDERRKVLHNNSQSFILGRRFFIIVGVCLSEQHIAYTGTFMEHTLASYKGVATQAWAKLHAQIKS